jgi:hypothetical protein
MILLAITLIFEIFSLRKLKGLNLGKNIFILNDND